MKFPLKDLLNWYT